MRGVLAVGAALVIGGVWAQTAAAAAVPDTELTVAPAEGARVASNQSPVVARSAQADTFECSLDDKPWYACGIPDAGGSATLALPGMYDGEHTLRVRARLGADVDPSPAARRWIVDTTAPETTITPLDGGAFSFTSNEPATFSCRLDRGPARPCSDPLGVVPYGPHVLEATATDAAGNADPTPATYFWTNPAPPVATPAAVAAPSTFAAPAAPAADNTGPVTAPPLEAQPLPLKLRYTFRRGHFTRISTNREVKITLKRPGRRAVPVTLSQLVRLKLANGTKITFKAGTDTKTLTVRRGRVR